LTPLVKLGLLIDWLTHAKLEKEALIRMLVKQLSNLLLSLSLHRCCILGILKLSSLAKLRGLLLVHLLDLYLYLVRRLRLYTRLGLRLLNPRVILLQLGADLLLLVSDLSLVLAVCVIALQLLYMLQAINRVRRLLLDIDILILLRLSKQTLIQLVEHHLLAGH